MSDAKYKAFFEANQLAGEDFVSEMTDGESVHISHWMRLCESPIEARMLGALRWGWFGYNPYGIFSVAVDDDFRPGPKSSLAGCVYIVPQKEVFEYRVDFMLYAGDRLGGWIVVAIECDGHDFHDRTKEQAARDRSRDRALAAMGICTIRFTGAEIYNDVQKCVVEISAIVTQKIDERLAAAGVKVDRFAQRCTIPSHLADRYSRYDLLDDPANPPKRFTPEPAPDEDA